MGEKSDTNSESVARKTLEAWIQNYNLWCHDPSQSGWQSEKK